MSDIGLMFSQDLIPKIMAGTKTETRRLKGLKLINEAPDFWVSAKHLEGNLWQMTSRNGYPRIINCPYKVGDQMYCKETWAVDKLWDDYKPSYIAYIDPGATVFYMADGEKPEWAGRTRSAMFMTKRFARTWRELTDVRCERLWDMTDDGAKAEGFASVEAFKNKWDSLNKKHPWSSNCWVFVLDWRTK